MATTRLPMRKVKEILRMKLSDGLSHRVIARALEISVGSVGSVSVRAKGLGISTWADVSDIDEASLEALLYGQPAGAGQRAPLPDPVFIHQELKRPGVTLELLHIEYLRSHPDGYRYTSFCNHYKRWEKSAQLSMRQVHKAGEKLFTDYSGKKPHIVDAATGEITEVELFVATLGASNYTYAEASMSQKAPDWAMSHVRALEYIGGVPKLLVPDQLRSAVSQACRYEPGIQRTYEEMAHHYKTVVLPARPYRPKDKAKVEVAVQIVQRWILARLRNEIFYSLGELNLRIKQLLAELNRRPMKSYGAKSRQELFDSLDRPALGPLPERRWEYATWKPAKVNIDYHVEFDGHYYSVPYRYAREGVEIRASESAIEVFHKGKRIASHVRSKGGPRHCTKSEHMPKSHQRHENWSPSRLIHWASSIGPNTEKLAREILDSRPHPEQGYRSVLGLMALRKTYPHDRLEAACARAVLLRVRSVRQVKTILQSGLDRVAYEPPSETQQQQLPLDHENVRGPNYYN